MRKHLTEFLGTFFFLLVIGLVVTAKAPMAPLVIGCVLMVIVYMGGHVSGGHYNPAVSLAVLIRGKLGIGDFIGYLIAQLLGALAGTFVVFILKGELPVVRPAAGVEIIHAVLVELLFTFLLCLVVLNVATSKRTEGNSYYGLAIGFAIVVAAFAAGGISGGAFNPAIGTAPNLLPMFWGEPYPTYMWIYWAGPFAGAVLAALVFFMQEGDEAK